MDITTVTQKKNGHHDTDSPKGIGKYTLDFLIYTLY